MDKLNVQTAVDVISDSGQIFKQNTFQDYVIWRHLQQQEKLEMISSSICCLGSFFFDTYILI